MEQKFNTVVNERNQRLNEHLQVVLLEHDNILYENNEFNKTLTTLPTYTNTKGVLSEDSLASRKEDHLAKLEQDLTKNETRILQMKVDLLATELHIKNRKLDISCQPKCESLLMVLFQNSCFSTICEEKCFTNKLKIFVEKVTQICEKEFLPQLLHDTSSSLLDGGEDTVAKEIFGEKMDAAKESQGNKQLWPQRILSLALGLILYRLLCQSENVANIKVIRDTTNRFKNVFFEIGHILSAFITNIWILDHIPKEMTAEEVNDISKELHVLHLQGGLQAYFSPQQLESVFKITRGPYVAGVI